MQPIDNVKQNKIILFHSPQGGSGKTTLAVTTAIFSAILGKRTLLVDMSIYGNIMSTLKIPQTGGIGLASIIVLLDLMDSGISTLHSPDMKESIKASIVPYPTVENMDILISGSPVKMESINEDKAKRILQLLKSLQYEIIIIDSCSGLSELNLTLLENADHVVTPVTQDISCGWKMVLFKEMLEMFSISNEKVGVIINKCSKYNEFNNKEFENVLGYKISAEIPYFHKNFQKYVNDNISINKMQNKKAFKAFCKAVKGILNIETGEQNERGKYHKKKAD